MALSPFEILSAIAGLVLFWARVEHRMTRMEECIKNQLCNNCVSYRMAVPIKHK